MNYKFSNAKELLSYVETKSQREISSPINIDLILTELGVQIMEITENGSIVAKLQINGTQPRMILNQEYCFCLPYKRFVIAHMLGHYILQNVPPNTTIEETKDTLNREKTYWISCESEATTFATQLLLPKWLLISKVHETVTNYLTENHCKNMPVDLFIGKIAIKFDVSTLLMRFRLEDIGMINSYEDNIQQTVF